ncbi:MAG: hypothetical protein QNK03_16620 [Myxococcota bacterium]|nr:hypothetical protein [Myxococcota bacterium]
MEGVPVASLADSDITPDPGSINPYQVGEDRSADNRSFTVWVVTEGVQAPAGASNVIVVPAELESVGVMTRVYRVDRDFAFENAPCSGPETYGGCPPQIESLKADLTSGETPESLWQHLDEVLGAVSGAVMNSDLAEYWSGTQALYGDEIVFHRYGRLASLFPSEFNHYVLASVKQSYASKVAVLTFVPPTFEDTYTGRDMEGGKDVRYWSFCVGDWATSGTTDCLIDDEAVKNPHGTVTIAIGPTYMRPVIENAGLNYLRWGTLTRPLLIHRHMLADESFEGAIGNVPLFLAPPAQDGARRDCYEDHAAVHFMGEYAPSGRVYRTIEFLRWLRSR